MKVPVKKLRSGFSLPVYGLGTWTMGGKMEHNLDNDDKADISAIKNAIEEGVIHIDTAEVYANGHSERLVGQAIKGYKRKNLFITSKVYSSHLRYKEVLKAIEGSLERLQTDYLDLYLVHAPNPDIPMEETFRAFDELVEKKLIRNIGVSNFTKERLKEAQKLAKNKIVTNQVHYSLEFREPQSSGLLAYCIQNDILLTAYRPLERGKFVSNTPVLLKKLSKKYNKTISQIALNWLISQENVVVLTKTRSKKNLLENLGALGWELEKEDTELLNQEYPVHTDFEFPLR